MAEQAATLVAQGLEHFARRDHVQASACWLQALTLDPGNVRAREFLSYLKIIPAEPPVALCLDPGLFPVPPPPCVTPTGPLPELPPLPPRVVAPPPATNRQATPVGLPAVGPRDDGFAPKGAKVRTEPLPETTPAFGSPVPPRRTTTPAPAKPPEATPRPDEWFNNEEADTAAAPVSLDAEPTPAPGTSALLIAESLADLEPDPASARAQAIVPTSPPAGWSAGAQWSATAAPASHGAEQGIASLFAEGEEPASPPPDEDSLDGLDVDVDDLAPPSSEVTPGRGTPVPEPRRFADVPTPVGTPAVAVPAESPATPANPKVQELLGVMAAQETAGDLTAALDAADKVLELDPNHADALGFMARNEETLVGMYAGMLGSMDRVPHVLIQPDDVTWLNLHHKAGFVLSHVDGTSSFEDILALSGMSPLETCRILSQLLLNGVIAT